MARRPAPGPTISDLEGLLVRDYELNGRRSLRRALAAMRNVAAKLDTIDPDRAYIQSQDYACARFADGARPATVRYEIALLGRALSLAYRLRMIATHPVLVRPMVHNARQGFLGRGEAKRLFHYLPDPIRDMAIFAYITGWRRAEVLGLTWAHVEIDTWVIRLEPGTTKNLEGRTYPAGAHPQLRRMFERRWRRCQGPYVFHRNGRRVVTFDRSWESACRKAGLGHTLFHDLRRSAVRNMERAGVPRSVAMQLTGHRTESIYRRYAITNEEDLARGVQLVAREAKKEQRGRRARQEASAEHELRGLRGAGAKGHGVEVGQEERQEKSLTADNTVVTVEE